MKTKSMTLRLEQELATQLELVAQLEDLTVTDVIRASLREYVSKLEVDRDFRERLDRHLERTRALFDQRRSGTSQEPESGTDT